MTETEMRDEFFDYQRMWSKRYLQRVRSCVHTIAMIRSEIAEIDINKDGLKAVRYDVDNVGGTPDDDAMARRVERMDSLKAEFQEELDRNLQAQADAHRALSKVRQPWRSLLTYRYLQGMTWADVTAALKASGNSYAEEYVRKEMHDNALIELFPFIPHEFDEFPEAI